MARQHSALFILITVDSMPSPTCTASASPGFTSTTALLDVLVQSLYARDVNDSRLGRRLRHRITFLSRYFPESVCTVVIGVRYSL